MKALLVYESMFGNTESVAREVAVGLGTALRTDIHTAMSAPTVIPDDVVLLVVGAPVHALGPSPHGANDEAARQAHRAGLAARSLSVGVQDWLDALSPCGIPAVSFDTRIGDRFPAQALHPIRCRLLRLGFDVQAHESFYARTSMGPLAEGELLHARRWAERIADHVASVAPAD